MVRSSLLRAAVTSALVSVAGSAFAGDSAAVPLFPGLSGFGRPVTTSSPEAQKDFDQGLACCWGFHHEEAIRSFEEAARLDPDCAMAYWGAALASGPNINNPAMEDEAVQAAWTSLQAALERSESGTPVEKALIRALEKRYRDPAATPATNADGAEDRSALDLAYADAMREVWNAHPDDADVAALFAEAVMVLRPWDLWSKEGEPRPETPEIVATLEKCLELSPSHPGALHYTIHTLEASPNPERALDAANRLRHLVPAAGHLMHMPSHIDIRVGRYREAIESNRRAVAADLQYLDDGGTSGFYTIYRAHNYHFLAWAAMFAGQRETAMTAAREMNEQLPLEMVLAYADWLDAFVAVPVHVMVRFGLWNDLLEEPAPPAELPLSTAYWHYGRTVAYAALGRTDEGKAELAALKEAADNVPESVLVGNNTGRTVLEIGVPFAEGELEYRLGNVDRAFELLRIAVERDDALKYDEPWGWMEPVRHALGALLVEQGRLEEAEAVYRADLERHPENGWALHGLAEVLQKTGREKEAAEADARFRKAWAVADIPIKASCYCRTKT
jgi:tetratricopeptide (TPR) repeat protein